MPNDFVYIVNKKGNEDKPEPTISAERLMEYAEDVKKLFVDEDTHSRIHNQNSDMEKIENTIPERNFPTDDKHIKNRLLELQFAVEQKRFMRSSFEECVDYLIENGVTLARYGEWIVGADGSYMCSECGKVFRYEIEDYCSNCGSKNEYNEG